MFKNYMNLLGLKKYQKNSMVIEVIMSILSIYKSINLIQVLISKINNKL